MNHLIPFWFIVIAVLWTGFFILEGFDFGVGMLHSLVGKDESSRRAAINTIGPLWDGNEVWLITAGAAMFAAFPGWYATMFSGLYLALVLLLAALIVRGVAFEYRGKRDSVRWRRTWDGLLTVGSLLAPLLIGVALGDLLTGLPINSSHEYTGSFWNLLQPYALVTGVTLVLNRVRVRRDHGHHGGLHRVDLRGPVSQRDGVRHQPGQQPHRAQQRVRRLLAQGDDGRGDHLASGRAGLPGLDLLRVPPASQPRMRRNRGQ
jgi:bd-type cytochrome oxidase subunit II